jgi:hypothetical protein
VEAHDERERSTDDDLVAEEEARAAEEAAGIGGTAGDEDLDPAERPVREAGGGEAEGFEQAEDQLVEQAEHGDGGYAGVEAFEDDPGDRSGAVYAEPDEIDSTEVVRDPNEGPEDPGAGPGLAPSR